MRTGRTADPVPAPHSAIAVRPELTVAQQYAHTLQAKQQYAEFLAGSNLLPRAYQNQPSNILWALEYGQALGISPIAAMMGIHVIEGRASASAGLIQGLVRQAGHSFRITGDARQATCTIIRSDDRANPFVVTFTWDDAVRAGVTGKTVWKQYPAAMLKARATTACARDACQEVLFGLMYTPEELGKDVADGDYFPEEASYGSWSPAETTEDGPESPASPERLKGVVEAFRLRGMKGIGKIKTAIVTIIGPQRDEDSPLGDPPNLTVEECEFIVSELEGITDLPGLEAYLESLKAVDAELVAEGEGEQQQEEAAGDQD